MGTHANGNTLIKNISLDLVKVGDDPHHVAASKNCKKDGINQADMMMMMDTSNEKDEEGRNLLISFLPPIGLWTAQCRCLGNLR